jgi:hypothetical protein
MNWSDGLWLDLIGRWVADQAMLPEQVVGDPIWLRPNTISRENEALGLINLDPIPLDEQLLSAQWVLCGYRIREAADPQQSALLRLSYGLAMDRPIYGALPPGAIQPEASTQPLFAMNPSTMQRNPCPGYKERVFLYRDQSQPFKASAVVYTDVDGLIASVELFEQKLRKATCDIARRCWVSFYR